MQGVRFCLCAFSSQKASRTSICSCSRSRMSGRNVRNGGNKGDEDSGLVECFAGKAGKGDPRSEIGYGGHVPGWESLA